jgi:hypothetical protein
MRTAVTANRPRHGWDRYVFYATVGALIIESFAGTAALLRVFGPELWRTLGGHLTVGESPGSPCGRCCRSSSRSTPSSC